MPRQIALVYTNFHHLLTIRCINNYDHFLLDGLNHFFPSLIQVLNIMNFGDFDQFYENHFFPLLKVRILIKEPITSAKVIIIPFLPSFNGKMQNYFQYISNAPL